MEMPMPTPIKLEDETQVIDLDTHTSSEDIILEWCTKVRLKFKNFFIADSERSLDTLMKWYIQSFKEDATNIEDVGAVKPLLFKHIEFFKLFFHELDCPFTDNYLDNMEELLSMYSDLEARSLPSKENEPNKRAYKKAISNVCHKIIKILNTFLMYREDRMYHVLMKIKMNTHSEETLDLLNVLYGKFLTRDPTNKSDLAFCRAYILYQKWKKIRRPEDWEQMDQLVYKMYNRSPDSLRTNNTLKQILSPQSESILGVLAHISDNYTVIAEAYFKFIQTQDIQEDSLVSLDVMNIEIEKDDQSGVDVEANKENENSENAHNTYAESTANAPEECAVDSTLKVEEEEEDECRIVGIGTLDCDPDNTELVHEIFDDGDDIASMIFFMKKQSNNTAQVSSSREEASTSFLDSIDLSRPREPSPSRSPCTSTASTSEELRTSSANEPPGTSNAEEVPNFTNEPSTSRSVNNVSPRMCSSEDFSISGFNATVAASQNCTDASPSRTLSAGRQKFSPPGCASIVPLSRASVNSEEFSPPPVLEVEDASPSREEAAPSPVFAVPSRKPPRTRKRILREAFRKKKIILRKMTKSKRRRRRVVPSIKDTLIDVRKDDKPAGQPDLPKSVSHIETQTDFLPGEPDDIYKRFKGLVTPPSDEHNEDRDVHLAESSNVYAGFIACSTRNRATNDRFSMSSIDKAVGVDDVKDKDNVSNSRFECEETNAEVENHSRVIDSRDFNGQSGKVPEVKSLTPAPRRTSCRPDFVSGSLYKEKNTSSSSPPPNPFITPATSPPKNSKCIVLSNISCTSSDFVSDYSPSSSTVSEYKKSKRSQSYLSLASPDISSTSHDNYTESLSTREGEPEEADLIYANISRDLSDNEGDDYASENEKEVESREKSSRSSDEPDINDSSDEILIEDHFLNISEGQDFEGESPINLDNENGEDAAGVVHSSLSNNEEANTSVGSQNEDPEEGSEVESCQVRQLKVSVPKISLDISNLNSEHMKKPREKDFVKFEKAVLHSNWNNLLMNHDLDDILSGPIEKVNGISVCLNPDKNFDLFDDKTSPGNRTTSTMVSEVTSPTYEAMDDFQSYLDLFKDNGTNVVEVTGPRRDPQVPKNKIACAANKEQPVKPLIAVRKLDLPSDTPNVFKPPPVRKKRIAFAENVIFTASTHSPNDISDGAVQGILKNADAESNRLGVVKRNTRPRIPRRMMNLKTLAQYSVKPSDPCIQGVPTVVVERLSQTEIDQWLRVSEISRRVRMQRTQAQNSSTSLYRIDYNKSGTGNDIIQVNKSQGSVVYSMSANMKQWRPNTTPSRLEDSREGTSTSRTSTYLSDNDYTWARFSVRTLVVAVSHCVDSTNRSKTRYDTLLNLSCEPDFSVSKCQNCPNLNPFSSSRPVRRKKRKLSHESTEVEASKSDYFYVASIIKSPDRCSSNLDLNIISSIVESFDNKSNDSVDGFLTFDKNSNDDSLNVNFENSHNPALNQQPAIVPELEDFEKTLKSEESAKPSTIPSDLHNLNLNRFSPSPVINCFSSRSNSPGHMFLSDSAALNDSHFSCNELSQPGESTNYGIQPDKFFSRDNSFESFKYNSELGSPNAENKPDRKDFQEEVKREPKLSDSADYNKILAKLDMNSLEEEPETRLPLKKRKLSVANSKGEESQDDFIGPDLVEEILKRARAERIEKEDISYPAKPAISIAEIQEKLVEPQPRPFKTPAEKKEMPPPPPSSSSKPPAASFLEHPKIVTEQYNNHTYNNPTINYHMNNVPYPFFPCASLSYFPPILLPTTFDMNLVPPQQQKTQQQTAPEDIGRPRREKKSKKKKRD
ncbi:hypothetical protein JTB14_018550 [Gonioctena quinquepunctata]|nr:hypothetical protein JTB14_018550 [Gonioctena quinquepunctata]